MLEEKRFFADRGKAICWSLLILSAFAVYLISICSPIHSYAGMDPRGSSLVAQSLIERGTLRVDGYKLPAASWLFQVKNGHTYSTYPVGTSIFLLPMVAVALSQGADMQVDSIDLALQKRVAGFTVVGFLFLAYFILRCFLGPISSALFSAGWTLGSGVMSSMGSALWSINLAVIFECLVVLVVVRYYTSRSSQLRPFLVGFFLFSAYLCRPSAALLAIPTWILFWRVSRVAALKMAAMFGSLLLLLQCLFSLREFGVWLPDYYSTYGKVGGPGFADWVKALYGLTFGPARGLFVFQPFLLLLLLAVILGLSKLWHKPLFWLAASWIILELWLVSRWPMWWGGGSFGSRLLVESFPAWVILSGLVWEELSKPPVQRTVMAVCFGMLFGAGIFINSFQGLYNWSTWEWNAMPGSLGQHSENYFDWRYPQFLANPDMIERMREEQGSQ